ncbi:MAG: hypothetical protein VB959_02360, partial [Rhodospirillales bacterium]
ARVHRPDPLSIDRRRITPCIGFQKANPLFRVVNPTLGERPQKLGKPDGNILNLSRIKQGFAMTLS